MLSHTTLFLWLALPPLACLFRKALPHPIFRREPAMLYVAVVIAGTILYAASLWILDKELVYAWRKFDLDRDGELAPDEYTPTAREAMRQWSSDTGRNVAPFFAAPVTLVYAGLWFAILGPAGWVLQKIAMRKRDRKAGAGAAV